MADTKTPATGPDTTAKAAATPARRKPAGERTVRQVAVRATPVRKSAAEPVATTVPVEVPTPEVPTPEVTTPEVTTPETPAAASHGTTAAAPSKDTRIMTSTEYTEKFQTAIKDASEKAKAAFEKSQSQFGEMGEFAKGNVEAVVESTKILAAGLQEMGKGYLTEGKTAMEALTAEIKDLTAVKTPAEFMEKQTALLRKQFDAAVAASSKTSEAMLKLANDAFQPISTRVSLAVEKIKHAA